MANKNWKNGLIVFIVLIVVGIVAAIFSVATGKRNDDSRPAPKERNERRSPTDGIFVNLSKKNRRRKITADYIAVLHIEGIIQEEGDTYNQEWLLDTIDELKEDRFNKGIVLFLDTPGGTVYEADEAYLALMDYKKSGKPIYAYMAHMAASGGYYIACAADKIYANRNTVTGSIGVINGTSFDATELFEKIGLKPSTFTAGRNKNMRGLDSPVTDEQRKIIQDELNEAYDQFTGIIAESRKMKIEKVRQLADGRTYTARQAKANGLIDEIGTFDDAVEALNKFLEAEYDVFDYEYYYERSMFDYLHRFSRAKTDSNVEKLAGQLSATINKIMPNIKYPAFLYLEN